MPILGSHTSIAGGLYRAVERASDVGCDCVQIFTANPNQWGLSPQPPPTGTKAVQFGRDSTKNNNQWRAKELTDEDADKFREALARTGVRHPIAHDSYLINLAAPDDVLWNKSIDALAIELERAEKLGLAYVVTHPGAFTTSSEAAGLARIAAALDEIHRRLPELRVQVLLENTAGQGSNLGWRFEHLAEIIAAVREPARLGVCIDTCHLLAAGYPLSTDDEYAATFAELDRVVGLSRVQAIHVNDSKQGLGSRVDRHEHIGRGQLGAEPFRRLLNDPRWQTTPMYLETAKEQENGEEMDVVNLRVLKGLVKSE